MEFSIIMSICFYVFLGYLGVCLLWYLPRFICWFGAFKTQKRVYSEKKHRIAIIIPARNESRAILDMFKSLSCQTYDKEFFDVHVIVKDENDKTVAICRENGAFCHIAKEQTCKGDALEFCLKELISEKYPNKYDAFFMVDADCMIEERCIEEMNNAMSSGKDVIQAKKIVKNYLSKDKKANSLTSSCNGIIWTIIDELGNRFKSDHNFVNMTIGTGIMFTRKVIEKIGGWPYRKTLTEDIEFMNDCVLQNFSTYYYSHAKIYVEESTSLKVTNKRRTRWLTGVIDSKKLYIKRLRKFAKTPKLKMDKYYATALTPVFFYIGGLAVYGWINLIFAAITLLFQSALFYQAIFYAALSWLIIYVSFFIMTAFCMILDRKYINLSFMKKIILLFSHPIFYMGYIRIIGKKLVFNSNKGWEVIERMEFEDLEVQKS